MQALSLCQKVCPDKIPVITTTKIGDGADGEVFEIKDYSDRVIKFCVLYQYQYDIDNSFNNIKQVLSFIKNTQPPVCARVYEYDFLSSSYKDTYKGKQKFILYYYVMEKLQKISDDEKKVFHSILSHEDRGIEKKFSEAKLKKILSGLSMGLDFDENNVKFFYKKIKESGILHHDLHVRNIMKTSCGDFKLIDFDRAELEI